MTRPILAALPRFGLFVLACVPVLTGTTVLISMATGTVDALTNAADQLRRASYPVALVSHIIGASAMLLLGFAQFSSGLRRRHPGWHRWSGRLVVAGGVAYALSGLWMNAAVLAQADSALYDAAQTVMAGALLGCLHLGVRSIRQGRVAQHRLWMMRVYAISLGAATQTMMLLPVFLLVGPPNGVLGDLVFISGWVINLSVAEFLLRHQNR